VSPCRGPHLAPELKRSTPADKPGGGLDKQFPASRSRLGQEQSDRGHRFGDARAVDFEEANNKLSYCHSHSANRLTYVSNYPLLPPATCTWICSDWVTRLLYYSSWQTLACGHCLPSPVPYLGRYLDISINTAATPKAQRDYFAQQRFRNSFRQLQDTVSLHTASTPKSNQPAHSQSLASQAVPRRLSKNGTPTNNPPYDRSFSTPSINHKKQFSKCRQGLRHRRRLRTTKFDRPNQDSPCTVVVSSARFPTWVPF
jgi:hypothetical protein